MADKNTAAASTADSGKIRVGAGYKLLPASAAVKDTGRVGIGAGYKLLPRG